MTTPPEAPAPVPAELRLYDPHDNVAVDVSLAAATEASVASVVSAQLLDVSNFQGRFPWSAVKAGYPALAGGIYKMTEGTGFIDADANWNSTQIKANGLQHGAYHFGHPGLSAVTQAQFFVAQHRSIGLLETDMLWLDYEVDDGVTPAVSAAWAVSFMNELHSLCPNNPMGVYTYINFISTGHCAGLGSWPLWLSYPNLSSPAAPPPWHNWTFWQWGMRNGIDADAFNGTAEGLNAWIASYADPPPPSTGPYLHHLSLSSFGSVAAARGTTTRHIMELSAQNWTQADYQRMGVTRAPGFPYYTTNP